MALAKTRTYNLWASAPFYFVHVVALVGVLVTGWSWTGFALAVGLYYVRMFGVTAGYHRYFSHRTFKTSRAFQLVLALLAQSSLQKGVLWWAAHHRHHHKHSDEPVDVHSVRQDGFFYSHVGWILSRETERTDMKRVADLARFPELRWLNEHHLVPGVALAALLLALGGTHALLWGFFVSTTFLWHGTFTINSLCHVFGRRRYRTDDDSKNSFLLALVTLGEGWHNNHHYYPRSTAQGFFWWEIDVTFYVLRALALVGLVRDLHVPSKAVLAAQRVAAPEAPPPVTLALPMPAASDAE